MTYNLATQLNFLITNYSKTFLGYSSENLIVVDKNKYIYLFTFQQSKVNVRVARIFNTYGPRLDPTDGRVVSNFIMAALHNQPLNIYGDGSQTRSLCYVSDLVDGILRMADSKISGPINLGNPNEMTVLQLAQRIIELTRSQSTINFQSSLPDDPQQRNPDITLAKSKLDWFPHTDLDTGLQSTIHWMSTMERK